MKTPDSVTKLIDAGCGHDVAHQLVFSDLADGVFWLRKNRVVQRSLQKVISRYKLGERL